MRQLNLYGFQKLKDSSCCKFRHPLFRRGAIHDLKLIKRNVKNAKDKSVKESQLSDDEHDYKSLSKRLVSYKTNFKVLLKQVESLRAERDELAKVVTENDLLSQSNLTRKLLFIVAKITNGSNDGLVYQMKKELNMLEENLCININCISLADQEMGLCNNCQPILSESQYFTSIVTKLLAVIKQNDDSETIQPDSKCTNPDNISNYDEERNHKIDLDTPNKILGQSVTNRVLIPRLNIHCLYEEMKETSNVTSPVNDMSFFSKDSIFNFELNYNNTNIHESGLKGGFCCCKKHLP